VEKESPMSCEEVQEWLTLYFDDGLIEAERAACDRHLHVCPVCRAKLSEFRAITRTLRVLPAPAAPAKLNISINRALNAAALARQRRKNATWEERIEDWLLVWFQPRPIRYAFSSVASVLLFFSVFMALRPHMVALHEAVLVAQAEMGPPAVDVVEGFDINQPISPESYVAMRGARFSAESPSLNPSGALAALAWSHANERHGRDDMTVVADVFSNGVASLADVVQAPRDRRMLDDFQKALRQDAAFVPASLDRRPDTMRVIFSVQRVNVKDRNF
jgi:anti-sigma factor RsiW